MMGLVSFFIGFALGFRMPLLRFVVLICVGTAAYAGALVAYGSTPMEILWASVICLVAAQLGYFVAVLIAAARTAQLRSQSSDSKEQRSSVVAQPPSLVTSGRSPSTTLHHRKDLP